MAAPVELYHHHFHSLLLLAFVVPVARDIFTVLIDSGSSRLIVEVLWQWGPIFIELLLVIETHLLLCLRILSILVSDDPNFLLAREVDIADLALLTGSLFTS